MGAGTVAFQHAWPFDGACGQGRRVVNVRLTRLPVQPHSGGLRPLPCDLPFAERWQCVDRLQDAEPDADQFYLAAAFAAVKIGPAMRFDELLRQRGCVEAASSPSGSETVNSKAWPK